jgi:hypothetical protein
VSFVYRFTLLLCVLGLAPMFAFALWFSVQTGFRPMLDLPFLLTLATPLLCGVVALCSR